ncbi:MAG: hypothetical protein K6T83_04655 [Alicyclobacillus sp.]|nr:hypothetical protein [Alicyclobacillus sp.]
MSLLERTVQQYEYQTSAFGYLPPAFYLPPEMCINRPDSSEPDRTQTGQEVWNSWVISPIELLGCYYNFNDYVAVTKFLTYNPQLIELLAEAYKQIPRYFDLDTICNLDVSRDSDEDQQEGYLLIQTKYDPEEALVRLDQLYRNWWFKVSHRSQSKLTIDVEYAY